MSTHGTRVENLHEDWVRLFYCAHVQMYQVGCSATSPIKHDRMIGVERILKRKSVKFCRICSIGALMLHLVNYFQGQPFLRLLTKKSTIVGIRLGRHLLNEGMLRGVSNDISNTIYIKFLINLEKWYRSYSIAQSMWHACTYSSCS